MPSTYTQNVGIEKPGTGDQSGTWGVTTNTNFDIIDRAVHGQAQIAISGSQDLTTNDGAVSDGSHTVIILTGSPGATFELRVTPTDQEKNFTIKNDSDSACRVIYKGVTYSSANGVEIASGATQAVTGDGGGSSGVFKSLTPNTDLVNDTTPQLGGDLDVNGNDIVSVSNGDIDIIPDGTGAVNITATTNITGDLDVDNININGNTITSTDANGNINLTPNGTGITNITGATDISGDLDVDNINIDGNTISSTDSNGDISITPDGSGSVIIDGLSHPQSDGTAGQVMVTDGSGNLSFSSSPSALGFYPQVIRLFTSGSSYAIPSGANAVLIRASGGGGGGAVWRFSGNAAANGSAGASTTVTNSTLGISITARGGNSGRVATGGLSDFLTGDSGGDVLEGGGSSGGSSYKDNYDVDMGDGRPANLVQKYVTGSSVGGETLTYSLGAGGNGGSAGGLTAANGAGGFVEIWVW